MYFDTVTTSFECITRDAKVNASLVGLENSARLAIVIFSVILLFNKNQDLLRFLPFINDLIAIRVLYATDSN